MNISFDLGSFTIVMLSCTLHVCWWADLHLQFYRSFPGPPDVSEADMHLLVMKYRDPDRPGLLNYLNLHHDIVALGEQVARERELIEAPSTQVDETRCMVSVLNMSKIS